MILSKLQECASDVDLGAVSEPVQLFLECEQKLYQATFAMLERVTASKNTLVEVGDDSAFDINLLAPVPIITAVQTMCKAQGWCAEAALQGTAR